MSHEPELGTISFTRANLSYVHTQKLPPLDGLRYADIRLGVLSVRMYGLELIRRNYWGALSLSPFNRPVDVEIVLSHSD